MSNKYAGYNDRRLEDGYGEESKAETEVAEEYREEGEDRARAHAEAQEQQALADKYTQSGATEDIAAYAAHHSGTDVNLTESSDSQLNRYPKIVL